MRWLAGAAAAVVLSSLLLDQGGRNGQLQRERAAATAALARAKARDERSAAERTVIQNMVDQHVDQKARMVQEIAEFQTQLNLLASRTEGLERVREQLKGLEEAFTQFRSVEDQFKSNLERLEKVSKEKPSGVSPRPI